MDFFLFQLFKKIVTVSLKLPLRAFNTFNSDPVLPKSPPNFKVSSQHQGQGVWVTHMFSWTAFMALAAKPMLRKTSVLVCEFSSASRWNSMVDRVPSIWVSCFSSLFFLFRACKAAKPGRNQGLHQKKQLHLLKRLSPSTLSGHRTAETWKQSALNTP